MRLLDAKHDYRGCDDEDCPQYPCRVYKEGCDAGFGQGRAVGYAEGYTVGYSEGETAGYASGG